MSSMPRAGEDAPLLGAAAAAAAAADGLASATGPGPGPGPGPGIGIGTATATAPAPAPALYAPRPPGVVRVDAAAARLTGRDRAWLFAAIFLVGYAYGLESQVRSAYQPYATSSFSLHSYLSTINVLRSVVAVAVQPTAAKLADVVGRFPLVAAAAVCYVVGMAVEATAPSVVVFCAGGLVYQVGYTAVVLLLEVLVADFSSMRARVFFSYVPALPFVVNTWISGSVTSAVLAVASWRWGIGMWCIIFPLASAPLLAALYAMDRPRSAADAAAAAADTDTDTDAGPPSKGRRDARACLLGLTRSRRRRCVRLVHQLDVVGLVGLVAAFGLVLAPLTVVGAGSLSLWRDPSIVAALAVGCLCVPLFVVWERRGARQPLVPFGLLRDRGVWSALAVRSLLNFAWSVQGNYLYTVLVVAFDFSVEAATRILSLFSFFGVVSGVVVGVVVYRLRRLKYIIVAGTCIFMVGFAVLCRFPGGASLRSRAGVVAGQVLLGLASGLFAYPTQASIQASATRDHVAILTGLYLSFYNVGSAFGTCLAGAIWSRTLLPALTANLAFQPNGTLARAIYDSPFPVVKLYPVGTEIRDAIISSYQHVQRVLCVAGLLLCVPMIAFALALRNPRLSEQQVQEEAQRDGEME